MNQTVINMLYAVPWWTALPILLTIAPILIVVKSFRMRDPDWHVDLLFFSVVVAFVWGLVLYGRWTA